jgi:hypothetical protein
MNEWIRFTLTLIGIAVCVLAEDYICWRLWVIRRSLFIAPPSYESLNTECPDYANSQANKQPVDEAMVIKKLNGRPDKPKHEGKNRNPNEEKYSLLSGFRHIPFLFREYSDVIIRRRSTKCKQNQPQIV